MVTTSAYLETHCTLTLTHWIILFVIIIYLNFSHILSLFTRFTSHQYISLTRNIFLIPDKTVDRRKLGFLTSVLQEFYSSIRLQLNFYQYYKWWTFFTWKRWHYWSNSLFFCSKVRYNSISILDEKELHCIIKSLYY